MPRNRITAAQARALIDRHLALRDEAAEDEACPDLALGFAADRDQAHEALAAALRACGPVAHRGRVWSATGWSVTSRRERDGA